MISARPIRTGRLSSQVLIAVVGIGLVVAVLAYFARTAVVAEVPDYGGAYVEGLAGFPQALNPVLANDEASHAVNALVFRGLIRLDEQGRPTPDLAEAWEVSPDGRVYTFRLHPEARWHDGVPVTADDVLYTVKTIQDQQYSGPLGQYWKDVGAEKADERTVKLTLEKGSFAPFIEYAAVGLLPSHLLGGISAHDLPAHRFSVAPVGTGPYQVTEVRPDRIMLEAAPTFFGPRPHLSRILFRVYPNHKTILSALERDEVEGVPMVEPEDAARLAKEKEVVVYTAPQASLMLLFFNLNHPLLADRNVRQAIASAVDRQKLIDAAREGRARPADSPVLPGSWAYSQEARRIRRRPPAGPGHPRPGRLEAGGGGGPADEGRAPAALRPPHQRPRGADAPGHRLAAAAGRGGDRGGGAGHRRRGPACRTSCSPGATSWPSTAGTRGASTPTPTPSGTPPSTPPTASTSPASPTAARTT